MVQAHEIVVNPENEWRLRSTPPQTWQKGVRRLDSKKYFMISCDTHLNPPVTLFRDRLDPKWHHLLPRLEKRENSRGTGSDGHRLRMAGYDFSRG